MWNLLFGPCQADSVAVIDEIVHLLCFHGEVDCFWDTLTSFYDKCAWFNLVSVWLLIKSPVFMTNYAITRDIHLNNIFPIFQLSGGLFLAMGLWLHLSNQGYATLYPSHLGLSADSAFILIGGLSIVISFFGCCGSFFESRCCLVIVSHRRVNVLIKQVAQSPFLSSL